MYAVGHVFGEIIGAWCGRGEPARMRIDVPHSDDLTAHAIERCDSVGLRIQPPPPPARNLVVGVGDTTRTLDRRAVYGLCTLDSVLKAMIALIDHIRAREGAGRIWFAGQPSYLHRRSEYANGLVATRIEGREEDDALGYPVVIPTGDGTRRVLIGAYYFHAPEATTRSDLIERARVRGRHGPFDYAKPLDPAELALVPLPEHSSLLKDVYETRPAVQDGPSCDRCGKPTGRGLDAWAGRHAACSPPLDGPEGSPWPVSGRGRTFANFHPPIDPLDVEYDGVPLRGLLQTDNDRMRERSKTPLVRTPAQRAAISAHWSAQLRAKVAASTAAEVQRERGRIACDPREPLDLED